MQDLREAQRTLDRTDWATGIRGQVLRNFGDTDARDLDILLTTVRGNAFFKAAADAAEQGISFYPLSDADRDFLASMLGSLDTSQSERQLRRNIDRMMDITVKSLGFDPTKPMPGAQEQVHRAVAANDNVPADQRSLVERIVLGDSPDVATAVRRGVGESLPTFKLTENQRRSPSPMPQNAADAAALALGGGAKAVGRFGRGVVRSGIRRVREDPIAAARDIGLGSTGISGGLGLLKLLQGFGDKPGE